ncbi:hypothetical protein [Roseovarius aquimarinus]|uniref:Uncharacterized protein n=1 Tax=Roseovarius aquimarinus TaxID=1229156 RepID=A0ABW7I659_9RHOB
MRHFGEAAHCSATTRASDLACAVLLDALEARLARPAECAGLIAEHVSRIRLLRDALCIDADTLDCLLWQKIDASALPHSEKRGISRLLFDLGAADLFDEVAPEPQNAGARPPADLGIERLALDVDFEVVEEIATALECGWDASALCERRLLENIVSVHWSLGRVGPRIASAEMSLLYRIAALELACSGLKLSTDSFVEAVSRTSGPGEPASRTDLMQFLKSRLTDYARAKARVASDLRLLRSSQEQNAA